MSSFEFWETSEKIWNYHLIWNKLTWNCYSLIYFNMKLLYFNLLQKKFFNRIWNFFDYEKWKHFFKNQNNLQFSYHLINAPILILFKIESQTLVLCLKISKYISHNRKLIWLDIRWYCEIISVFTRNKRFILCVCLQNFGEQP